MACIIDGTLRATAGTINMAAAVLAPRAGLDIYPHCLWAEGKRWRHRDYYWQSPGSFTFEFGRWSLDVSWNAPARAA